MGSPKEYAEGLRFAKDDLTMAISNIDRALAITARIEEEGQIDLTYTQDLRDMAQKLPEILQMIDTDTRAFEDMAKEQGGGESSSETPVTMAVDTTVI